MKAFRLPLILLMVLAATFLLTGFPAVLAGEEIVYRTGTSTPVYHRGTTRPVMMAESYNYRVREFRGIWVATVLNIDMPVQAGSGAADIEAYKGEYLEILERMELLGLNTLFFQVRPVNDAFYPSRFARWSPYLVESGVDPGWDPMQFMIEEAHGRGLEFHAWINPFRAAMPSAEHRQVSLAEFAATQHPNNAAADPANLLRWYHSPTESGIVLNPGLPAVRSFVAGIVKEILDNYDLDGIHLDDYFYHRFDAASGSDDDNRLDDEDYATFITYRGYFPATNQGVADWRREQTSLLIRELSDTIETHNRTTGRAVQFGVSPTGIWRNGDGSVESGSVTDGREHYQSYLYADSKFWVEQGWLDYIVPQSYWGLEYLDAPFADVIDWWVKVLDRPGMKTNLYAAHGLYRAAQGGSADWVGKIDEVENRLKYISKYDQVEGSSFFSYRNLKDPDSSNLVLQNGINALKRFWSKKATGPPLLRYPQVVAGRPENFRAEARGEDVVLRWEAVEGARGYLLFRVPAFNPVCLDNREHLLEYVIGETAHVDRGVKAGYHDYYAVSVSRANHLSSPARATGSYWWPGPPYGDLNGDGTVNVLDAVLVMRHVLELEELEPAVAPYADVNRDGRVDVTDVTMIVRRALEVTAGAA